MINIQHTLKAVVEYLSQGKLHEAENGCRQVLAADPDQPDALHILGVIAFNVGRLDMAKEFIDRAIALFPQNPSFYINMGNVLQAMNLVPEAVAYYKKSLALSPENPSANSNLGVAYKSMGLMEKAMETFDRALRQFERQPNAKADPAYADCRLNRALIHLVRGEFTPGWEEFEWRFGGSNTVRSVTGGEAWDGRPFSGKTLLVYEEQGMGDTIQFIRYLPMLRKLGGHVIFEASPSLVRLLSGFDGFDRLWVRNNGVDTRSVDTFDLRVPLMSLPRLLHTASPDTIPSPGPYLQADTGLARIWKNRLGDGEGLKVGVVWAGSPLNKNDRNRSVHLSAVAGLGEVAGVRLFSLQKDKYDGWTDASLARIFEKDLGEEVSDFADTAAVMAGLDLVISADTSVVHLAGALGVPVWTLIPFNPDWRWLLNREDSPWYRSMRLFRQEAPGEWDPVLKRIKAELSQLSG